MPICEDPKAMSLVEKSTDIIINQTNAKNLQGTLWQIHQVHLESTVLSLRKTSCWL